MLNFARRNIKLYFRDKAGIFFSLLGSIILLVLYFLFLGENMAAGMEGLPDAKPFINAWVFAGAVAVSTITTAMGAFSTMVTDRTEKRFNDFTVSPIKRSGLVGGYIINAIVVGFVMSLIMVIISQGILLMQGAIALTLRQGALVTLYLFLGVLSGSAMVFLPVSFIKSNNAFSAVSTVLGSMIGFFTGMYVPIGVLPEAMQWVVKLFPPSHAALLIRGVLMENAVLATFKDVPAAAVATFKEEMGLVYTFGDTTVTPIMSISFLLVTAVVFYALGLLSMRRKDK